MSKDTTPQPTENLYAPEDHSAQKDNNIQISDTYSGSILYRPPPEYAGFHPFNLNPPQRSFTMTTAPVTPKPAKNSPLLEQYKEGAVTIKLYEQKSGDKTYVNASIGKLYKDRQSGEWRESRSFSQNDMLKLQALLPQAREGIAKWQEHFRAQEQSKAQENSPQPAQTKYQDMREQRDAVMKQARSQHNTPEQERSHDHNRSR